MFMSKLEGYYEVGSDIGIENIVWMVFFIVVR